MAKTSIGWTNRVWNPCTGCDKISAGCKFCYAKAIAERFWATQYPHVIGEDGKERPRVFEDVQCHEDRLDEPLHWRDPSRVFVNSMSDLFHDDVPFEFVTHVFEVMAVASKHTFQILTKRPERMLQFSKDILGCSTKLPNVHIGVSVENRETYKKRVPFLALTPAAVRFISFEPLLESVGDLMLDGIFGGAYQWAIVGGESGPHARPFEVDWARQIWRQCRLADVRLFMKQMGSNVVDRNDAGFYADENDGRGWPRSSSERIEDLDTGYQGAPVRIHLKDRSGATPEEWPEDLRVQEFPK